MNINKNTLIEAEKAICLEALKQSGFNYVQAAKLLGISRGKLRAVSGIKAPSYKSNRYEPDVTNKYDVIKKILEGDL